MIYFLITFYIFILLLALYFLLPMFVQSDKLKAFLTFRTKDLVILKDFDGDTNIRLSFVVCGTRYVKRFKYLEAIQELNPDGTVGNALYPITWKYYK